MEWKRTWNNITAIALKKKKIHKTIALLYANIRPYMVVLSRRCRHSQVLKSGQNQGKEQRASLETT